MKLHGKLRAAKKLVRREIGNAVKYPQMRKYRPSFMQEPVKTIRADSGWSGIEKIIPAIIADFHLETNHCLEFGVEFGFSTVALSNYFSSVTGIDLFMGDDHTAFHGDHFEETSSRLAEYTNVQLIRSDYRDWIAADTKHYDLVHVDIVHTYEATYQCGLWAAEHSQCAIFHDTESFADVKRAVADIAKKTGKTFWNYPKSNGLGIVV